ncbi:replication initiation factor domain-containing protein [Leucothrix mucor]|uniref:replication initiation factor domain-containing protein n=1 Tax=Leucothrix mucor TaxID=45248 RepID=UPI0003B3896B|nr:replication initiation factor domain-containing protein [Leucothrix mucor]
MSKLPKGVVNAARASRNKAKKLQVEREALLSLKSNAVGGLDIDSSVTNQVRTTQPIDFKGAKNATYPPYCNTGGYELPNHAKDNLATNITKVDWLRLTVTDLDAFRASMGDIDGKGGILNSAGIETVWTEKGLHGYEQSAKLLMRRDADYLTLGHIATSETGRNKGGMFELTGLGCKLLQLNYPELWNELFSILQLNEWRISRADIALDLPGEYCLAKGYTVPLLFKQAVNEGLFRSDKLRNPNMLQSFGMAGDWSPLTVSDITPESYQPIKHCPAGLTAYIGSRKGSADFFRAYEKGKELLGSEAEPDSTDRAWVRIEHEMSRKGTGREIPLDVMLRPDAYFAIDRSGVRALMDEFRESLTLEQATQAQLTQFNREKNLLLSKKIHWAKQSYGRLFRTLIQRGIEYEKIIDWLTREDGLKDFIFDLEQEAA